MYYYLLLLNVFIFYLYNHGDESVYAHSSIKSASPIILLMLTRVTTTPNQLYPLELDYGSGY